MKFRIAAVLTCALLLLAGCTTYPSCWGCPEHLHPSRASTWRTADDLSVEHAR
jgi:hypothetical protein